MNQEQLFFKDKPIFGLDIGSSSIKVMQVDTTERRHKITAYGSNDFDPKLLKDGVIGDYEAMAKVGHELIKDKLIGSLTTRRVCMSLPATHSYHHNVRLPKLDTDEIKDAVASEIEQYIPVSSESLYSDYVVLEETNDHTDILIVATPQKIVDSYLNFAQILGLEIVGMETTIAASSRLFIQSEDNHVPAVLIDLGAESADLTVYDKGLIVTGTVACGGDDFTKAIMSTLNVTDKEAHLIKTKYGLGVSKKQKQIIECLSPTLSKLVREVRRMIRYYEDRTNSEKTIGQIITMGGGANMPGLSDYLTNVLRIPVRMCDPWQNLQHSKLQLPSVAEKSMYVTVAGLALAKPQELFK